MITSLVQPSVEVGDIFRACGEDYAVRHPVSAAQAAVLAAAWPRAARQRWEDTWMPVRAAATRVSLTTPAATGTAPSARACAKPAGCSTHGAHPGVPTSTSSSPFPAALRPIAPPTASASSSSSSRRHPRRSWHWGMILDGSADCSALRPSCTPGPEASRSTRTCIAWSPGALCAEGARGSAAQCDGNYLFRKRFWRISFAASFSPRSRAAWAAGELTFGGSVAALAEPAAFRRWLDGLYRQDWVVYAKRPFGGAEQVFRYLGRYSHRVAIANSRLLAFEDGRVSFRWKDYADDNRTKVMQVDADEFIRRFLLHVLPSRFVRHPAFWLAGGPQCHDQAATLSRTTRRGHDRSSRGRLQGGREPARGHGDRSVARFLSALSGAIDAVPTAAVGPDRYLPARRNLNASNRACQTELVVSDGEARPLPHELRRRPACVRRASPSLADGMKCPARDPVSSLRQRSIAAF